MTTKEAMILFLTLTAMVLGAVVVAEKFKSRDTVTGLRQQVKELSEKTCPAPTEEDCRRVFGVKLPENIKLSDKDAFIDPDGEQLPELNTVAMYKGRKCATAKEYTDSPHCLMCVGETWVRVYAPGTRDPFKENDRPTTIKIDDLKEGWAKFRYYGGSSNMNGEVDTMDVETICSVFKKVEK